MLGKLIKYDFKALNRFLIFIHVFLLGAAVFMRFVLTGRIQAQTPNKQLDFLLMLLSLLCILFYAAAAFGTQLIIAARFYKNLFTDEGYLTHTLPVTSGQHLLSKTFTGTIWCYIDILLIYFSLYIVIWTPYIKDSILAEKDVFMEELGFVGEYADMSFGTLIAIYLFYSLFGAFSSIVMIYASIALGQLFASHRILGAVVAYFTLTTVISILSLIIAAFTGNFGTYFIIADQTAKDASNFSFVGYMFDILKLSTVLETVTSAILYMITYYIMKKKTNLL